VFFRRCKSRRQIRRHEAEEIRWYPYPLPQKIFYLKPIGAGEEWRYFLVAVFTNAGQIILEITGEADLLPSGAASGTVPTDLEQATGLERLEILGKMEGIDIFDMKPLDASRKGKY
jgi:hypothetical protein